MDLKIPYQANLAAHHLYEFRAPGSVTRDEEYDLSGWLTREGSHGIADARIGIGCPGV
ncbi:MAG: hypothetical protein HY319_14905 [Armatimonadetes bacterium]|nr:hypothetical protein [Armatimonadota bacterium]